MKAVVGIVLVGNMLFLYYVFLRRTTVEDPWVLLLISFYIFQWAIRGYYNEYWGK